MKQILNKKRILKAVFVAWVALWILFLIREDKDGQYSALRYLYTHNYVDKLRYIMGGELCDFLVFCKQNMPQDATYELMGFERFSIGKVRARYFLWPSKSVKEASDFKLVYGKENVKVPGYKKYKQYNGAGCLLIKEDIGR